MKDVTKGRLECLVLNGETPLLTPEAIDGATPLFDVVRFDERVKHVANYFRNAYVVETVGPGLGTWPTNIRTAALSPPRAKSFTAMSSAGASTRRSGRFR